MVQKNFIRSYFLPLAVGAAIGVLLSMAMVLKTSAELKKYKNGESKLKTDYTELKAKYEGLVVDRNNVLTQTKILLGEKGKYADLEEAYQALQTRYKNQLMRKQKLFQYDKKLESENMSLMRAYDQIVLERNELQKRYEALDAEKKKLTADYARKVEETPAYKTIDAEAKRLKNENQKLAASVKTFEADMKKSNAKIKAQGDELSKVKKELSEVKKERDGLKNDRKNLTSQNKELAKTAKIAPSKFRTIAEENRQMLRETADMHYNLGVFYMKQKNYSMAVSELKRALDFNPDNPKVHYNLGVLYADEYENHPEAIWHLKRFLEIDPRAKEADHARNYLLVREAYGDKMRVTK